MQHSYVLINVTNNAAQLAAARGALTTVQLRAQHALTKPPLQNMGRVACQGPARPYKIWNLHLTIPPNGVSGSRKLVYFNTCGTLHADQFGQMQRNCEIDNACIRIWPMQRNRVADLKRAPHHTVMQ